MVLGFLDKCHEFWCRETHRYGKALSSSKFLPILMFVLAVIFASAMYPGQSKVVEVNDQSVWSPEGSTGVILSAKYSSSFANSATPIPIILTFFTEDGSDILTVDRLTTILTTYEALDGDFAPEGTDLTFDTMCHTVPLSGCLVTSVLSYFNYSATNISAVSEDTGIAAYLVSTFEAENVSVATQLGNWNSESQTASGVRVMMMLNGSLSTEVITEYSEAFYLYGKTIADSLGNGVKLGIYALYGLSVEFDNIFDDLILPRFIAAAIVMVVYISFVYSAIGKRVSILVHSRYLLIFFGLLHIGFTYLASYGIAGYCGINTTTLAYVLPFLLLGLSFDQWLLLSSSVSHYLIEAESKLQRRLTNEELSEVFAQGARETLPSISLTSLTSAVAFFSGLLSSTPAIADFSLLAGIAMVCLLVLFFAMIPIVWWDLKRMNARRNVFLCCMRSNFGYIAVDPLKEENKTHWFDHVIRFCMDKRVRWVIIALFIITPLYGLYVNDRLSRSTDYTSMIPDSPAKDAIDALDTYESPREINFAFVEIFNKSKSFYNDFSTMKENVLAQSEWMLSIDDDPLSTLIGFAPLLTPTCVDSDYYPINDTCFDLLFDTVMNSSLYSASITPYVVLESDVKGFESFRFTGETKEVDIIKDADSLIEYAHHFYDLGVEITQNFSSYASTSNSQFLFNSDLFVEADQHETIDQQAITTTLTAVVCVLVVTVLFMGSSLIFPLILTGTILSIIFSVFTVLYATDSSFDSIASCCLIMVSAMAVDLISHVLFDFVSSKKRSSFDRYRSAIHHIGVSVLNAGITTVLGLAVLGIESPMLPLKSFSLILSSIIITGLFAAFFLLPALLSFVGDRVSVGDTSASDKELDSTRVIPAPESGPESVISIPPPAPVPNDPVITEIQPEFVHVDPGLDAVPDDVLADQDTEAVADDIVEAVGDESVEAVSDESQEADVGHIDSELEADNAHIDSGDVSSDPVVEAPTHSDVGSCDHMFDVDDDGVVHSTDE